MTLYEDVVAAVRSANEFGPDQDDEFAAHLRTLVPALHALRQSYRSGHGTVEVAYSRAVTEAYLLAYYPHYVRMTWKAMRLLPPGALPHRETFRLCVFAPGPAPEPVAVGRIKQGTATSLQQDPGQPPARIWRT